MTNPHQIARQSSDQSTSAPIQPKPTPNQSTFAPIHQYAISREALSILSSTTDAKGRRLQVVKLPCPPVLKRTQEEWDTLVSGWGVFRVGGVGGVQGVG